MHELTTGRLKMELQKTFISWPVIKQMTSSDPLARGKSSQSKRSANLIPRTNTADKIVQSVCPYCAVGCGQTVYVKNNKVTQVEGDKNSPISRGRLCPKGSATEQLVNSPNRQTKVLYRKPFGTEWEPIDLEQATEMVAQRIVETRARTWQDQDDQGRVLNRTMGIAGLGGATLDNEENYLIKKLLMSIGAVQIENQARI